MLGCAARPGNLGVSTRPVKKGPCRMPSIVSAWQLAPEGKHGRGDGTVVCTECQHQPARTAAQAVVSVGFT